MSLLYYPYGPNITISFYSLGCFAYDNKSVCAEGWLFSSTVRLPFRVHTGGLNTQKLSRIFLLTIWRGGPAYQSRRHILFQNLPAAHFHMRGSTFQQLTLASVDSLLIYCRRFREKIFLWGNTGVTRSSSSRQRPRLLHFGTPFRSRM